MIGTILKATNCSFQKGMPFCRSIYVKKMMKLLAFIFEQPSQKKIEYYSTEDQRRFGGHSVLCQLNQLK